MTELHMGLLAFGGVAVVGVLAYNKWQERKHRQVAEQMLRPSDDDVLLDAPGAAEAETAEEGGDDEEYAVLIQRDANGQIVRPGQRREPMLDPEPLVQERQEPVLALDDEEPTPEPLRPFLADPEPAAPLFATASVAAPAAATAKAAQAPAPAYQPPPASESRTPATQPDLAPWDDPLPVAAPQAAGGIPAGMPASAPATEPEAPRSLMAPALPAFLLSAAADYIVALETVDFIPAVQFIESQRDALLRITKRITWVGLNEGSGEWEVMDINSPQEYRRLRIGVQLADRRGAISDAELSIFHTAMRQLAEEFMAVADLPTRKAALEDAYELDRFCADVDIQIGINVVAVGQLFPGTKIRALAEAAGMVLDSEGAFVRRDDDGRVLYTLSHQGQQPFTVEAMKSLSCHGLTFLLDVPRVPNGDRVFSQMSDLARRFADSLHGVVVDDNRQPLTETLLEPIRKQVAQYQGVMAQRGLVAGAPLSLRLFA
jgi:FtsZ-interacting cell division protein ZipA